MAIKIEGTFPKISRVPTGLYGLNAALADTHSAGLPDRGGVEIYGRWETGKSTLAYYLSGWVRAKGRIVLIDLEGAARKDYLEACLKHSGFSGVLKVVSYERDGKMRTHEDMLQEGADSLYDPDVGCLILDSAAMTRPVMEAEGDLDEAFMGRRAQVLAKWSRRWNNIVNYMPDNKLVIVVNHMLQDMQGYGKISPGGDTLKFGIFARLWIRRRETFDDGAFVSEVAVEKLRFGGRAKNRKTEVVFLPGIGVSPELSNLWTAMDLGMARRRKGGMVQYLDGEEWTNIARRSIIFRDVANGDTKKLKPLLEKLEEHYDNQSSD